MDNLVSHWAYMVMSGLAWNLKAWFALMVPEHPRHKEQHQEQKRRLLGMEFKRLVNAIIEMPYPCERHTTQDARPKPRLFKDKGWTPCGGPSGSPGTER